MSRLRTPSTRDSTGARRHATGPVRDPPIEPVSGPAGSHYTPTRDRWDRPVVSGADEGGETFSLAVEAGVVVLRWAAGVHITGPLAAEAMDVVDRLNREDKRPLLVDMRGIGRLARDARAEFERECQVSRLAIVGSSPVDRVIAHFGLQVSSTTMPSRYFDSMPAGLSWLRDDDAGGGARPS